MVTRRRSRPSHAPHETRSHVTRSHGTHWYGAPPVRRIAALAIGISAALGVAAVVVVGGTPGPARADQGAVRGAGARPDRPDTSPPECRWNDLRTVGGLNGRSFGRGQKVVMTTRVTNVGQSECTIVIGADHGFDPTQDVRRSGNTYWDACWLRDRPGACFDIWLTHKLAPGGSYSLTSQWDQRTGTDSKPPRQVVAGTYAFVTDYADLVGSTVHNAVARLSFVIR